MQVTCFKEWTCTFPGKMGLSWKRAWNGVGTKEEAEAQASKSYNVVAVPLQLFEKVKEHERRMVKAEAELMEVCVAKSNESTISTVGDLKELLKHSEDDEPLNFYLEQSGTLFDKNIRLKCVGVGSTAGGRATLIWFQLRE